MRRVLALSLALAGCSFSPAVPTGDGGPDLSDCGDGAVQSTETCDDGNTRGGDGCDNSCRVESYFLCVGEPSVCTNPPPNAMDDDAYVDVGGTINVNVLGNDTDHGGEPFTLVSVDRPTFGTLTHDTMWVTMTGTSSGVEFVTYRVQDLAGGRGAARIRFRVGVPNRAPVAQPLQIMTGIDVPIGVRLDATDEDQDTLTYAVIDMPANGTLTELVGDELTYRPNAGFFGRDTFTYRANDGELDSEIATVTVDVIRAWWDTDWLRRRRITIDTTGFSNVRDVPVRVPLAASVLMGEGARADGRDLRFVSLDGSTVFPHELVGWPNNHAAAWITVPTFTAPEVELWVYYDHDDAGPPASNPWSGDYHAVFHFDDDLVDTISGDAQQVSNVYRLFSSLTGRGLMVDEEENVSLDVTTLRMETGALCLWFLAAQSSGDIVELSRSGQGQGSGGELLLELDSSDRLRCTMDSGNSNALFTTGQSIDQGWHFACLRWDVVADTLDLSKNGVVIGGGAASSPFDVDRLRFDHEEDGFAGPVDEVWILTDPPSDDWIRAQAVLGLGSVITTGPLEDVP
ncbi:MAG: Ig-like domain-containing protein [Deltaproteobacteria bacterium]